MSSETAKAAAGSDTITARIEALSCFQGAPAEFWSAYLALVAEVTGAGLALLALRDTDTPSGAVKWRPVAVWPSQDGAEPSPETRHVAQAALEAAESCLASGCELRTVSATGRAGDGGVLLAVRLATGNPADRCVAACFVPRSTPDRARSLLSALQLAASIPVSYQTGRMLAQAKADVGQFANVLDLMVLLNAETRFMAAAMRLCNELAARHRCDRVSLGWKVDEYIRLQAMSHTEKFERKMDAVRRIEQLMEEAMDQNEEILWPVSAESSVIARDHEAFSRELGVPCLCSLPLRLDGKVVAVLCAERGVTPFSPLDVGQFRLCGDQVVRRLSDLKRTDRWLGARWAGAARENLAKLAGPEHTWAKVGAVAAAIVLGVLLFGVAPYRVEAPFLVRTDKAMLLPTPFDGYIAEVMVRAGDVLRKGDTLVALDTRDLLLEQAASVAEYERYLREAEKARAQENLAEMRIAQAQADQARVRLDLVKYRLDQARIRAPFDSVVMEGDLRERVGSPVRQGETLFRVGRLGDLYVELEVNENDSDDVQANAEGQIAFASQPGKAFPVRIVRVEPAAQAKSNKNVFLARADFSDVPPEWCRPGMSGVAKISVGRRNLLWILTHRTVDFLRLKLWW
ncbi:MAG: hypothetical protein A3K19_28855 [Lentisphaerae bacterium RIFOXYB12_FULL_65_16]|nr:MAG: hypothetical protein A3K18_25440 [Lentisphaerae bacterium RIFOXYA12_64_32]OGV88304.1 MAG: hypothetical protein A3K19_28855 [Lentisphaerae bacterium RIFOXYB12_FULL_65_16]